MNEEDVKLKNLPSEMQELIMSFPRQLGPQAILVNIKNPLDTGLLEKAELEWLRIPGNWNLLVDAVHEYSGARQPEAFWGPATTPSNSTRFAEFLDGLSEDQYYNFEENIKGDLQKYE